MKDVLFFISEIIYQLFYSYAFFRYTFCVYVCVVVVAPTHTLSLEDDTLIIHNASEFVAFSNDVNSGTSYSEKTVLLGSDINFNFLHL